MASAPPSNKRRVLPFFVEFVKFATGFVCIIALALLALRIASATL